MQNAAPAVGQYESTDHQVGAARSRRKIALELRHQDFPDFLLDQSDLPATALIGIADQSAARDELRRVDRIHGPALHSFDPNFAEFTCIHASSLYTLDL